MFLALTTAIGAGTAAEEAPLELLDDNYLKAASWIIGLVVDYFLC